MPVSSAQFGQVPWPYVTGLGISNDATTPNTKLDVAAGSILDSTGVYQITLSTAVVINAATNGLNGLDTGSLAASTVYAVHVVADPVSLQNTGCMISLSSTAPLLPFGYSAFALIGYVTTDSSVHFLPGLWNSGNTTRRTFMYDAPQATAVTAGASTTYANVNLIALVPNVTKSLVYINTAFTPGAASRVLNLQPAGNTGDDITITGQVTSVVINGSSKMFQRQATISSVVSPAISYKVTNSGDAVAINVLGYEFSI